MKGRSQPPLRGLTVMLERLAMMLTRKGKKHYANEHDRSLESYGILPCMTDVKVFSIEM